MNTPWWDCGPGTPIGPHRVTLRPEANERYWRAAGLDHPVLAAGAAYPLVCANATVLAWLDTCPTPVIQTRQRLRTHRLVATPVELETTGSVVERSERRGREYAVVRVDVATVDGDLVWTSEVDFTPVQTVSRPTDAEAAERRSAAPEPGRPERLRGEPRRLTITDDAIRQYSRRGNYHSEASSASELGLPGLVAQGTQVCGPAVGLLLDAWGADWCAHGTLDVRFVGMVMGGDTVEARADIRGDRAAIEVWNVARDRVAAVGTASVARYDDAG
jgi:acyl dehydratase